MSLTKAYKTDDKKEIEGAEIKMPPNDDGSVPTFIVARTSQSNERYTKALERIMRPHQALVRTKQLKNKQANDLLRQAFVEGALNSWQNVMLADVTGVETDEGFADFSKENAAKLFDNLPELYAYLQECAADISVYKAAVSEESAKN